MADQDDAQPPHGAAEIKAETGNAKAEVGPVDTASTGTPAAEPVVAVSEPVEIKATEPLSAAATLPAAAARPTPKSVWLPMVVPIKAEPASDDDTMIADEWPAPRTASARSGSRKPNWMRWLTSRAAVIAAAAAIGAVAGSGVSMGPGWILATPDETTSAEDPVEALRQSVSQLAAEIKSLQTAVGQSSQSAAGGLAALEERLDGAEQTQSELATQIASLSDGLAKRQGPKAAAVSPETTGSITRQKPPVAKDWVLWRVQNGRALVQGNGGYFEVAPGSSLPGLGLVQRIMRQDGRWVVMTRNGLIVARG